MTATTQPHPRSVCQIISGASTFRAGALEHDSDIERLYFALYPRGNASEAGEAAGLSREQVEREMAVLREMRFVEPQGDDLLCTMPLVSESDRELMRVWAEPIADVVLRRLDKLHGDMQGLTRHVRDDRAKSTVMTFACHAAVRRPFESLRQQMKTSAPDRGRFGEFRIAMFVSFTSHWPPEDLVFQGGWGAHWDHETRIGSYMCHPRDTGRPGLAELDRRFPSSDEFQSVSGAAVHRLACLAVPELTPELMTRVADELGLAQEGRDDFWAMLADLHAVRTENETTRIIIPRLPPAVWAAYLLMLDGVGEELNDAAADAADDLRKRALRCSFADCYFADSVFAFFTYLEHVVGAAISRKQWVTFPPEADYSWGAMIVS